MRDSRSASARLRQCIAGLAMVLVAAPGATAQTLFEKHDPARPGPSRPFRVTFDRQATTPPIQTDMARWSLASNADASSIQFKPPRRKYHGTSSSSMKSAQKLTAAVALGIVGGFAGGLLGGALTHSGQSRGMNGFVIGAPIGAVVGAFTGYWLVK